MQNMHKVNIYAKLTHLVFYIYSYTLYCICFICVCKFFLIFFILLFKFDYNIYINYFYNVSYKKFLYNLFCIKIYLFPSLKTDSNFPIFNIILVELFTAYPFSILLKNIVNPAIKPLIIELIIIFIGEFDSDIIFINIDAPQAPDSIPQISPIISQQNTDTFSAFVNSNLPSFAPLILSFTSLLNSTIEPAVTATPIISINTFIVKNITIIKIEMRIDAVFNTNSDSILNEILKAKVRKKILIDQFKLMFFLLFILTILFL